MMRKLETVLTIEPDDDVMKTSKRCSFSSLFFRLFCLFFKIVIN